MLMILCIVSSASVTNFFPTVVETLNFGKIETLLLTAPPYVLAVICAFANAWHADRSGERYLHVTLPLYIAVAAFIIAATTTAVAPRYLSMMLMVPSLYTGYVVALGWISNTLPRPASKRAAALAGINCVSNASSIYASYMYPDSDAPRFSTPLSFCTLDSTNRCASHRYERQLLHGLCRHRLRHRAARPPRPAEQEARPRRGHHRRRAGPGELEGIPLFGLDSTCVWTHLLRVHDPRHSPESTYESNQIKSIKSMFITSLQSKRGVYAYCNLSSLQPGLNAPSAATRTASNELSAT